MNINIVRPFLPALAGISEAFGECLATGMVTNNGPHVRNFEGQLKTFLGCQSTPLCFNNGEMALFHLIQAWKTHLGYGPHDSFDVLVPSFTFSGTLNAIVLNNLRPVFCDIDETLTLSASRLEKIGPDVKMMIAVGVYGNLPDINSLRDVAEAHKLVLLFDNAPAFGSKYNNAFTCNLGYSEIYSFHATKVFSSMEGGAAIVSNPEVEALTMQLRDFGQYEKTRGDVAIPGLNSKMQEVSALVGLANLARIDEILASRQKQIASYQAFFASQEALGHLRNMVVKDEVDCTYLYYPVILHEDATSFVDHMQQHGIGVRRYYTAVHKLKYYAGKYQEMDLSFTNEIKDKIVSLPLHTIMSDQEVAYLFDTITSYFGDNK